MQPSACGELEITDLSRMYLEDETLNVVTLSRGYAWLDIGTMESLFEACEFVRAVERSQGLAMSVIEEIAYDNGWIDRDTLIAAAEKYGKSVYGQHLKRVTEGKIAPQKDMNETAVYSYYRSFWSARQRIQTFARDRYV